MSSERSSWSSLTTLQKVALGLGIPASGAILYILYRRYTESREEHLTFVGEDEIEVDMKIPKDAVKLLIGCHGANIKQLRKETCTRIEMELEESGEERLLQIYGSPVQVCKAKAAIHKLLAERLQIEETIRVPQRAVGRIIGRGGETVRAICSRSGAKVMCERDAEGAGSLLLTRLITLTGTRKEVNAAKKLILEKVSEEEAFREKLTQSVSARMIRKQPLGTRRVEAPKDQEGPLFPNGEFFHQPEGPLPQEAAKEKDQVAYSPDEPQELRSEGQSPQDSVSGTSLASSTFEVPSPDFSFHANENLEVYISAAENPNHFWVQIIGSRTLLLDKLTEEMFLYYNSSDCSSKVTSVRVGDIVAAPYLDGSWYRARVLGTLETGKLDLYYVDFGDNGDAPLEKLQTLRSDFLSLPFQAIECSLAGVAPVGDQWEEKALDEFDRLTHCAEWKPVMAKISSYVPSGSSTWPHIQLYNITGGQSIDVGEELVRLGYAVRCPQDEEVDGMGDGPHQAEKGAAAGGLYKTLEATTETSLDSLLSDPQKTPDEMPLTLSCISLSDEPMEQARNNSETPAPESSPEGLVPSLEFLLIDTVATSYPSEAPSLLVGQAAGSNGVGSRRDLPVETPAQADVPTETASLLDAVAFGAGISQASSPAARHQPPLGEASLLVSFSSERSGDTDLTLDLPDSSTYSPRGYFYYDSASDEGLSDSSAFCKGSPSLDKPFWNGSPSPSPCSTFVSTSASSGGGKAEAPGEEDAALVSGNDDILLSEEDSLAS